PFLIPLLSQTEHSTAPTPVANPLEEESVLKKCDWQEVASRTRQEYGLDLLVELPQAGQIRLLEETHALRSPQRCLLVESPQACWFVLEHPSALPLFDRHGLSGQRPALARPTLFIDWITGRTKDTSERSGNQKAELSEDTDSLTAFHGHLASLIDRGRPSDWHLEPQQGRYASRLRIEGRLSPVEWVAKSKGDWLINSVLSCSGLGTNQPGIALEGRFSLPLNGGQILPVRVSLIPSIHGYALVMRFLYPHQPGNGQLKSLGMSNDQEDTLQKAYQGKDGLWLVAGPTGAGKSTTLHALLHLSVKRNEKVLAVEDPVERIVPGVQHLQIGRPAALTFAKAVRAFMRQAPDCLLVGEIRDQETAEIALQAARTGHRVLSSIHARSTSGVQRRFMDLGQAPDQVAKICTVLIHQRLVPRICPFCLAWREPSEAWQAALKKAALPIPVQVPEAHGCLHCTGGSHSRIGLFHLDDFLSRLRTREGLLAIALNHVSSGQMGLASIHPFLPDEIRRKFPLCQK
ncbi:MAG TPA: ATPase, T2SS/T4P/T4SS family, partial [Oceanipulchritudo sp.]|nr:ATPase, T2SS/T4P/T4SS family [Oceanipulchritudo sp.]